MEGGWESIAGVALQELSAACNMYDAWKYSRAAGVRPISLWKVMSRKGHVRWGMNRCTCSGDIWISDAEKANIAKLAEACSCRVWCAWVEGVSS